MNPSIRIAEFLSFSIVFCGAIACSTPGNVRGSDAANRMQTMREAANETKRQTSVVATALDGLVQGTGGDSKAGYEKFSRELDIANSNSKKLEDSYEAMRSGTQKYFDEWQVKIGEIGNEELRKSSIARREEQMQSIATLDKAMQESRTTLAPFMNHLRDAKTYLATDLSTPGIQSLKPTAKNIASENGDVDKSLDKLVAAIDKVLPEFKLETPPAN